MLEILTLVIDYLAIPDLIHFARVSKRMREMVYDDTRWVQKLQLMGCWSESAARARVEQDRRKKLEALNAIHGGDRETGKPGGTEHIGINGDIRKPSIVLSFVPGKQNEPSPHLDEDLLRAQDDGFDFTTLSLASPDLPSPHQPLDNAALLDVMSKVRSIRGSARQEYGRVHGALGPFYKDAVRSKQPSNARIFRLYRDPNQQARMLSQLMKFAKCDTSQGWQQRHKKLDKTVLAFEDAVFREYEQGLKIQDVDGRIKKYVNVLVTLNGGQRAIDRFIEENVLFRKKSEFGDPMDCISPTNLDVLFLEESHAFFGRLSTTFNAQVDIIDRGFPASVNVIIPILLKTEKELIAPYLNALFSYVHKRNTESYVRAISGTYEQLLAFAKSVTPMQSWEDEFRGALDQSIANIFAPHVELFLTEELAFFKRKADIEVHNWERQLSQQDLSIESLYMAGVNRQADKRDFLSSFKKVVMMPVNVLPAFPISTRFGGKSATAKALVNGETLEPSKSPSSQNSSRSGTPIPQHSLSNGPSRSATPIPEPPTTELAAKAAIMKSRLEGIRSLFSLEVALNLVHMAKASIERAAVFAKVKGKVGADARTQCETIFILLVNTLGTRHVKAGFDQAVEHLSKYNPRAANDRETQPGVAPLVTFLELVNVGDLIQQMLDVFYEQELVATKLTDRHDFLNPTIKEKKRFEQMLDERVAAGLNKGIEVLMAEVDFICSTTQNVEDFNPGATGMIIGKVVDIMPTNTATWVVEVVSGHTQMLAGSTDKNMLDVFNQEVGLRLFATLCKHIKKQRVSVAGSIRLIW
jgi:recyclin-1